MGYWRLRMVSRGEAGSKDVVTEDRLLTSQGGDGSDEGVGVVGQNTQRQNSKVAVSGLY